MSPDISVRRGKARILSGCEPHPTIVVYGTPLKYNSAWSFARLPRCLAAVRRKPPATTDAIRLPRVPVSNPAAVNGPVGFVSDGLFRHTARATHSTGRQCRRLCTIPPIGPIVALALVAAAGNRTQLRRSRDMAA